ncbi:MAG: penicillin-binding protein 2 [Firmicutes bacterium]|nr:penicillin-binding protein 2 [Bacillota bacterium]
MNRKIRRRHRVLFLAFFSALFFLLLLGRLTYIQLMKNGELAEGAVRQRAFTILLDYNRGDILDRNGISLLGGKKEKQLVVFPAFLAKEEAGVTEQVSAYLPPVATAGNPFIARHGLDEQEENMFKELQKVGLLVVPCWQRYGPKALATHVTGHIGPADGKGRVGLELTFNDVLQSDSPTILAAVIDNKNNLVDGLGYRLWRKKETYKPFDLVLTIDRRIQKEVEEVMDARLVRGAVVIMDPLNGDILAMASRPNYMQAELSRYLGDLERQEDFLKAQPFINRSILSYPPGSVFKTVVAAAALDSGTTGLGRKFYCPGYIRVGEREFRCQHGPHGVISLADAYAYSCNAAFIELALDLGREIIYEYATALGLGEETGLPLGNTGQGGEAKGRIPRPGEMLYGGDLALTAIGQGRVEASPLQVARLTAAVANGGLLVEPRLVQAIQTRQGLLLHRYPTVSPRRVLKVQTAAKLRHMMQGVVEYGTGCAAADDMLVLGGKTGTAETKRFLEGKPLVYAWFTGCVPLESSRAVVTVLIEESRQGSAAAAFKEIAQAIIPYLQ